MTEKHGVATRLLYQLYIALNNKKKANLTGVAMETMRPAAPAKLNVVESGIYKEVTYSTLLMTSFLKCHTSCLLQKKSKQGILY